MCIEVSRYICVAESCFSSICWPQRATPPSFLRTAARKTEFSGRGACGDDFNLLTVPTALVVHLSSVREGQKPKNVSQNASTGTLPVSLPLAWIAVKWCLSMRSGAAGKRDDSTQRLLSCQWRSLSWTGSGARICHRHLTLACWVWVGVSDVHWGWAGVSDVYFSVSRCLWCLFEGEQCLWCLILY